MIAKRIDCGVKLDAIYKDILGTDFMHLFHDSMSFGEWRGNKRRIVKTFKLKFLELFDELNIFGDSCNLKVKQRLIGANDGDGFLLTNHIKLYDDNSILPDVRVQYNIKFNRESIEVDVSYDFKSVDEITKVIYESVLRIGLENLIEYHTNCLASAYQYRSSS